MNMLQGFLLFDVEDKIFTARTVVTRVVIEFCVVNIRVNCLSIVEL